MDNNTGWKFPPSFRNDGTDIEMVSDHIDIRESLYILFSTHPGERPINKDFGCNLRQFIFRRIDSQLIYEVETVVQKAIQKFEPRVNVLNINVIEEQEQEGKAMAVFIAYMIKETNEIGEFSYKSELE
ncbi:GPW/gp25 family protein [Flammeovirga kamogawensis]|uniref:GPW/gp25 family protein n=1 Tax=Flammeovirga kamogawensis TaxID=373891 RepID=A0ABX8GYT2_9BACT|nr:GPW/gp25 family protein [Flammeovirga kamogawensis]MBB6458855.1 hypothetical protein [Flammeovirga kamogawensis]QWG08436.1 GPW/gp25 family protein [Flammeovirga kamogawensis]TRX66733.1 GPW/gp25 family protein [Flammeovirga kamogawensis]